MCDIWKKEKGHELKIGEIEKVFRQLNPIDVIRISGGEPFFRNDIHNIIQVIDCAVKPKMIHITTNGIMTDSIIKTLKDLAAGLVRKIHIKVSIDDIGESHDFIRGLPGAYNKAMNTIEELVRLRGDKHFYLGVDQTVVNKKGMNSYVSLKETLGKFNINVHPVMAYDKTAPLYSEKATDVSPDNSCKTYGYFKTKELEDFILCLLKDSNSLSDFKERIVKRYYLKGLHNRLVKDKKIPNPSCVALNSHLRILPNGDIPVCMYNSTVAGNLRDDKFADIWFGNNMKKHREWIKQCKGCWAGCESNVNAIYSGDIYKGIF